MEELSVAEKRAVSAEKVRNSLRSSPIFPALLLTCLDQRL